MLTKFLAGIATLGFAFSLMLAPAISQDDPNARLRTIDAAWDCGIFLGTVAAGFIVLMKVAVFLRSLKDLASRHYSFLVVEQRGPTKLALAESLVTQGEQTRFKAGVSGSKVTY